MKRLFIALAVLALIALGAWYWRVSRSLSWDRVPENVSSFSVEGKVIEVSPDQIFVLAGKVEKTASGNAFVTRERLFSLAPEIVFVDGTASTTIRAAELGTRLKAGDEAVFYGSGKVSPFAKETFVVERVEWRSMSVDITPPPVPDTIPEK